MYTNCIGSMGDNSLLGFKKNLKKLAISCMASALFWQCREPVGSRVDMFEAVFYSLTEQKLNTSNYT